MASENLINDLFELIQLNTKESLSYDDFEKDLLKNLNLSNDEIDRALAIMRTQAEINPNILGETKDGKFIFSPKYSIAVISTIKYENQFIPGKKEFVERNFNNISKSDFFDTAVIMTDGVIDKMINNFGKLSVDEKISLLGTFTNMTEEQQDKVVEAQDKVLEWIWESPNTSEEDKKNISKARQENKSWHERAKKATKGDKESVAIIRSRLKNLKMIDVACFNALFQGFLGENDVDIDVLPEDLVFAMDRMRRSAIKQGLSLVYEYKVPENQKTVIEIDRPILLEKTEEFLREKFSKGQENDKGQQCTVSINMHELLQKDAEASASINYVDCLSKTIPSTFDKMFEELNLDEEQKIRCMVLYARLSAQLSDDEREVLKTHERK